MTVMEHAQGRHIGDILKERNIEIIGADPVTRHGFTQVPNFILTKNDISVYLVDLDSGAWGTDLPAYIKEMVGVERIIPIRSRSSMPRDGLGRGRGLTLSPYYGRPPRYFRNSSDMANT